MADILTVTGTGRLTKNAELKCPRPDFYVSEFYIAVNRKRRGEDTASYYQIRIYGKLAQNIYQYLKRGVKIAFSGSLQQDVWNQAGEERRKDFIAAADIQFMEPKNAST